MSEQEEPVGAGKPVDKPDAPSDEFEKGAKLTRAAGLWMLGALSAAGIGLFGAQPAVRGQAFSWTDDSDRVQLIAAAVFGFIGVVAIAYLIYRIARLQSAVRYTLSTLPPERQAWLEEHRQTELPKDAPTLADFQMNMIVTLQTIATYEREIQVLKNEVRGEKDRKAKADLLADLALFETALKQLKERHQIYLLWKSKILNEAQEFTINETLLGPKDKKWLVPGLIATIGVAGLFFTLALAKPPEEAPAAAAPELGVLKRGLDSAASQNLWTALALDTCQVLDGVPVLVLQTTNEMTSVRTLALKEGCRETSFSVIPQSGTVIKSEIPKVEIEYVPTKPSPTAK